MAYVTAVTNRTSSSYYNVADWSRVISNSRLVSSLASIMLGSAIQFDAVTDPTTSTNPLTALTKLNTMLANIERVRLAVIAVLPSLTEVKDDWLAGRANPSPTYQHANQWESTIDAIWTYYGGPALLVDTILSGDLIVPTATNAIYVDSIDTNGFNIEIQGTGNLYII